MNGTFADAASHHHVAAGLLAETEYLARTDPPLGQVELAFTLLLDPKPADLLGHQRRIIAFQIAEPYPLEGFIDLACEEVYQPPVDVEHRCHQQPVPKWFGIHSTIADIDFERLDTIDGGSDHSHCRRIGTLDLDEAAVPIEDLLARICSQSTE